MSRIVAAVVVTAAFAALAHALGMVSAGGAAGGFVVGAIIYISIGPQGFAILTLFVVGGSALTRLGYEIKDRGGTAQEHGGRRRAKNALANCAVATLCAVLAALTGYEAFTAAFIASLGAAFADTAESEIGQLYGRTPRLVTTLRPVPPGTDGAVSLPGTMAGAVAALLTATLGFSLGMLESTAVMLLVALAAFLGTVVDSLVGALASRVGNELTNMVCTLAAALLVLFLV